MGCLRIKSEVYRAFQYTKRFINFKCYYHFLSAWHTVSVQEMSAAFATNSAS